MNIDTFKDLVLLIGTNPLPNFVVAEYFLKRNKNIEKIWLVHSEKVESYSQAGTLELAKNLEKIIKARWEGKHEKLQFPLEKISLSDVSSASKITANIENMITKLKENNSFHFNYTGGTKSMSTHSYWTLKMVEDVEKSFSYLDGRNFRLILDESDKAIADDLREEVNITFKELIELHGFVRRNTKKNKKGNKNASSENDEKSILFPNTLKLFADIIEKDKLLEFYDKNNNGYNRKLFENKKEQLIDKKDILEKNNKDKIDNFVPNEIFKQIINSMPEEYRLLNENYKFNWDVSSSRYNKKYYKSLKYIDGGWFEEYIAKILNDKFCNKEDDEKNFKANLKISTNWIIEKTEWNDPDANFELDVIMVNGYQLTGISCTTAEKKYLCKSKGFEILHRTKQIGGDEAKAVLITFMDNKTRDIVQKELLHDAGVAQGNICVLGINDLKKDKLIKKIKKFVFDKN